MKCPNCNSPILSGDKFCGNCGFELKLDNIQFRNNSQIKETKPSNQKVSDWWYIISGILLPFGALFAWFVNKNKNPQEAKKFLLISLPTILIILISMVGVIIVILIENVHNQKKKALSDISKYTKSVGLVGCTVDKDWEIVNEATGFLIDSEGLVLTNYHAIENSYYPFCGIIFSDGFQKETEKYYKAFITKIYDPDLDYAVLYIKEERDEKNKEWREIKEKNFPYIKACNSDIVNLGDPILIIGYPSYGGETLTVTTGIISGSWGEYFKTDAKIDKGNSGSPVLLDDETKDCYIGIATFGIKGKFEGLGYILKTKYLKGIYEW